MKTNVSILHPLFSLLISLLFSVTLVAQDFISEVEGDMQVEGVLDVHYELDTSFLIIGYKAGTQVHTLSRTRRGDDEPVLIRNTFVGSQAGQFSSHGINNSFYGALSGQNSSLGSNNSFYGTSSGISNRGNDNAFYGFASGISNQWGVNNSFYGSQSGFNNTTGSYNSFFGTAAGVNNQTGSSNTYIGSNAGVSNHKGNGNTIIGELADITNTQDSLGGVIVIGHNAKVDCHNCAVIGGTGSHAVKVGIGVSGPQSVLHVKQRTVGPGSGIRMNLVTAGYWNMYLNPNKKFNFAGDSSRVGYIDDITGDYNAVSDLRLKKNIEPISDVLNKVIELEPTVYHYKRNKSSAPKTLGLIAQDVQALFPEIVSESEETLAIAYSKLSVIAIKAIQEQQDIIEALEERIGQLENN